MGGRGRLARSDTREGTKGKTKPAQAKHKAFYSGGLYGFRASLLAQTSLVA